MAAGTIVITGGTSGIGRAAALGFAAKGWQVAICGRRQAKLDEVRAAGSLAVASPVDVTDPQAVAAFFADVRRQFGRIDAVFNNAGAFSASSTFGDIEVATWQKMIDTNLNGAFYVAREAFRTMRDQSPQGGRIINNGSISAYAPRYGAASYTASKSAVAGLTKLLANEWAAKGINVNAIAPGYIETNNTEALRNDPERFDDILKRIPAGRWGRPDDIGGAAVFLASDAANYVHGAVVPVDGGWLAR